MNIPLPRISPAVRLSFGLVLFTLSVLLIIDMAGLIPKRSDMVLDTRKRVSESLAVQLSVAATSKDPYIVNSTLESFVKRNSDVIAASMAKESGELVAKFGEFSDASYQYANEDLSHEDLIFIPIFNGAERWGTVNVEFAPVYTGGVWGYFKQSIFGMLLIVALTCIVGFMFILRKALHFLDPKAVVPERVRTAFNTLSEGVLILDNNEKIMMANDAFASQVNKDPGSLLGTRASSLKWKLRKIDGEDQFPWINSIEEGVRKVGVALNLATPHMGVRSMSANSAPILDEEGKARGTLVTFDDITDVEESNVLLENAVTTLQKNDAEIRRKNKELEVLASRDALTGCYNRRAFFDFIEDMFKQTLSGEAGLVCIMVDIDHFKSINDRFGHAVGDEVIRMVADVLNACDYSSVVVGRYGGEEFCIALPGANLSQGNEIADTLRRNIKHASKKFSEEDLTVTASFGVATVEVHMTSITQLLDHADKALYIAKESGRDRVVTWVQGGDTEPSSQQHDVYKELPESEDNEDLQSNYNAEVKLLNRKIETLEARLEENETEFIKIRTNDPITELPTSVIFEDRVSQAMTFSSRADQFMAIAIMNINMFSRINNTLGQVVGDEFLKLVGQRLKSILRRSDTVASMVSPGQSGPSLSRLRDDEFALLLTGIDEIESIIYIVKRIQEKFAGKITVADHELYITTTIGLSLYPNDADDPKQLIEKARAAQKQAKEKAGKNNYQFYSKEINQQSREQMQLEVDMHNAIENNQFRLLYQPKLEMKTGEIRSVEALIRLDHPEKGLMTPNRFIPVAEKTGLIVDIGKWSLHTACKQAAVWVGMGAADLRVSVNISGVEFTNDAFVDNVKQALKQNNLAASHLELEVTETAVMNDLEKSARLIEELRYIGVTIAMDDFGTGYSSFSYLGNLKFDWIKIDRNFLLDSTKHKHSKTLYDGMVAMAHEIDLKVVAEGVEKQAEYNYAHKIGVDEIQGYIISKPVDAAEAERILFSKNDKRKIVG